MNTQLDAFEDLLLREVVYDGSSLTVRLDGLDPRRAVAGHAVVKFDHCCLHLVAEEVIDASWPQPESAGFLTMVEEGDPLREALDVAALPFFDGHQHFRLRTRDEIVHVFARSEPVISITAGSPD